MYADTFGRGNDRFNMSSTADNSVHGPSFRAGDEVEALFRGKGTKWFPGRISNLNSDGTIDIRYDDGDTEVGANPLNVRFKDAQSRPAMSTFNEGDRIEALFKGKGTKWFPGTILSANRDSTFDIRYDDGDLEKGALGVNIRSLGRPSTDVDNSSVDADLKELRFQIQRAVDEGADLLACFE
jgi:ribosomal protein L27